MSVVERENRAVSTPAVVHLELHADNRAGASAFYAALLDWRTERIDDRAPAAHHDRVRIVAKG